MKSRDRKQLDLIDTGEPWQEHWRGMPEFIQENQKPFKTILLHFESQADVDAFSNLIGQRIKGNTKFLWYPEIKIGSYKGKAWRDAK